MEKRHDQQTRIESKTRVVVRIKMCVSSGDYSSALVLLRGAAGEFPNDAELSELEKVAQDGVKRKAEADRLITESQELFAQQKFGKAIHSLRAAYELDKNNALARTILANALVEHAHSVADSDWWEAETLANEALALNPAHPTAKTIPGRILDQKIAASIEEWISQTRKLQSSGNLSAALSQVAEGLAVYPREAKLLQIQDEIQRDHSVQRRQTRRRDLDELRRMEAEIDAVADGAARKALSDRIQAMASKYSVDGEILSVANGLLRRLGSIELPRKSGPASPDSEGTPLFDHALFLGALKATVAASSQMPASPLSPSPALSGPATSGPSSARSVPPAKAQPTNVPPTNVPHESVTAEKVLTTPPAPPAPARPVPAAEPSAQAARVTTPASSATASASASPQRKQVARSNSTKLIIGAVSAAAILMIATIFFFFRAKALCCFSGGHNRHRSLYFSGPRFYVC